jgi:hypothetical protein
MLSSVHISSSDQTPACPNHATRAGIETHISSAVWQISELIRTTDCVIVCSTEILSNYFSLAPDRTINLPRRRSFLRAGDRGARADETLLKETML